MGCTRGSYGTSTTRFNPHFAVKRHENCYDHSELRCIKYRLRRGIKNCGTNCGVSRGKARRSVTDWSDLTQELDAWRESNLCAEFWLRDDDAGAPEDSLKRLIGLCREYGIPANFAAIPAHSTAATAELIVRLKDAHVLIHGYAHTDHATKGERKTEYSAARPIDAVEREWGNAIRLIDQIYGTRALCVFVPPWNRMASALKQRLSEAGFIGYSALGTRSAATVKNLAVANVHVDLFDSRRGTFRGCDATLTGIVQHLRAKRIGTIDSSEPTGVMTHHLVFDAACWSFLRKLFDSTTGRQDVRWCAAPEIFGIAT